MKQEKNSFHTPVLLKVVLDYLNVKPGEVYIDATLGGGGHAKAILENGGSVLGIDQDPQALAYAKRRLQACPAPKARFGGKNVFFKVIEGNFAHLKDIWQDLGTTKVSGVLFDLGVSSHQLETEGRGFSFNCDEELDMRMSPNMAVKAVDLVNGLGRKELNELFTKYGEEKLAHKITKAVLESRKLGPVKTTGQLAGIIKRVYEKKRIKSKIHPATRVFQALRIAVNDEINSLKKALPQTLDILKSKGRLVIISFHGLEDKLVKQFFRQEEEKASLKILTKKPVAPNKREKQRNPRSRSAKLRAAEKI